MVDISTPISPIETYSQAEAFIMEALPMFQKVGKKAMGSYGLDRVNAFLDYLGNPHRTLTSIHIAGTNGKGSTAHMLAAIYQSNGYKTGLFTSPHLISYRERMKINGEYIPEEYVLSWVQKHFTYLSREPLSFFEMSMGLSCSWFQDEKIDIAIMETGLGGRLDATNVISPILSIITNIDWDHQDILGDSLAQIAYEKAGIIKPSVPVVLGNIDPELYPVFVEKARDTDSLLCFSDKIRITGKDSHEAGIRYILDGQSIPVTHVDLPTLGPYQEHNLLTVLHAAWLLKDRKGMELQWPAIGHGLEDFLQISRFRGRYEIIHQNPLVIADAAHNPGGIRFFNPLFQNKSVHLHLVIGMVKGKDADAILSLLPSNATYYFCAAKIARAMEAKELQTMAMRYGLKGEVYASPGQALLRLLENANEKDIGLVIGSIYLLEEILKYGYI